MECGYVTFRNHINFSHGHQRKIQEAYERVMVNRGKCDMSPIWRKTDLIESLWVEEKTRGDRRFSWQILQRDTSGRSLIIGYQKNLPI
jgi:hypothetical protein